MSKQHLTDAEIIRDSGLEEQVAELTREVLAASLRTQRGGSVTLTIKCKPDTDSDRVSVTGKVKAAWPVGECEAHQTQGESVLIKTVGDDPGQTTLGEDN